MITGKQNNDGSFSVAIPAEKLVKWAFVDFYDDDSGRGYQRMESMRRRRGSDIAKYIGRCVNRGVQPRLFELTANARVDDGRFAFERIDANHPVGILTVPNDREAWLSVIDGGTRLLGIQMAVEDGAIQPEFLVDVRVFQGLSLAEEIAQFLLINEKQKRVRTDLSLRVVQRLLDNDELEDHENKVLRTVVPESDSWRFSASRIAGRMNRDTDSPWASLIKMPNEEGSKPIKLQAFLSSLQPLLKNADLMAQLDALSGAMDGGDDVLVAILKNFWAAVREANPGAREEPMTTVLWGSIGVNACHNALAPILLSMLSASSVDVSSARFARMLVDSELASYPFWYSRPGARPRDAYPGEKGDATKMTGAANYGRLGRELEQEWRASLHGEKDVKRLIL